MTIQLGQNLGRLARWLAVAAVLLATLTPGSGEVGPGRCHPLSLTCGTTWAVDLVLNLALFLPIGIQARCSGLSVRRSLFLGLALSLLIETLQGTVIPGRDPSLRDLVANTLGAGVGALLVARRRLLLRPTRAEAGTLLPSVSVGLSLWLLTGALSLQPSLPRSEWFGQHRADLGGFDRFYGQILAATIGGAPLPSGPLDPDLVLRLSSQPGIAVQATVRRSPETTERLAPIVSVFDDRHRKIVVLAQLGTAAAVSPRVRGEDWGLEMIVARFPTPSPVGPGTAQLAASYAGGTISIRGSDQDGTAARAQRLGPAAWWRLLSPTPLALSNETAALGDAAALLLCFLPIGWLGSARSSGRARPGLGEGLAAVIPASIALVPLPFGLPTAPILAWGAALFGWYGGWWAHRRSKAGARAPLQPDAPGSRPGMH